MSAATKNTRHGRCEPCKLIYTWMGAPYLRDARCTRCGQSLGRGSMLGKEKHVFETPAGLTQVQYPADVPGEEWR